jgi:hypothetical protein
MVEAFGSCVGPTQSCCTVGTLKVIKFSKEYWGSEAKRMAYLVHRLIVSKKFWVLVGDVFAYITSTFEHLSAC